MNRSINAASARQVHVGGIHDGIRLHRCYVRLNQPKRGASNPGLRSDEIVLRVDGDAHSRLGDVGRCPEPATYHGDKEGLVTTAQKESVSVDDIRRAAARIKPVASVTPLLRQFSFDSDIRGQVYVKAENLQRTGSFKFRGAYNTLACLLETGRPARVITSSSGNHGQAVAAAGRLLGIDATVVMPTNAVATKVEAVRRYGARVVFAGTTSLDREARAKELGADQGGTVIGSFDDVRIIAGQGTSGLEIAEQFPDVDIVLVPVGGGGLISGVATAVKSLLPPVRVFGVEPEGAADAYLSLKTGEIVTLSKIDTICDGLRTSHIGSRNFPIMQRYLDGILLVSDDEVCDAVRWLAFISKLTVEPSGAVAIAALLAGKLNVAGQKVVAVVSGGNVDPGMFRSILNPVEDPA